jgi:Xaa-Pro dipeptidase
LAEISETLDRAKVPFDAGRLDRLMEEAGIDVLLATSKHNTRYLMGGYSFLFFSAMDAIGHSRYLPVLIYAKGRPDRAGYVGHRMEAFDHEVRPFWTPAIYTEAASTTDAATLAAAHLARIGAAGARIGIEPGFLPVDAQGVLAARLEGARFMDATGVLERLRAVKTPAELTKLREGSELITDAMLATIGWAREGTTKAEIIERLRREEVGRGLHFDYCLLTLGSSHNRAPSDQAWAAGEVLSIDSGGNLDGYIGDLARMGVLGEPDVELEDLLAEVEAVQQAAFSEVRAGAPGRGIGARALEVMAQGPNGGVSEFFAHGMGLVSHEAPFLMQNRMYDPVDADRPLEAGMVISVETTMQHPRRGYIKLEDTVAVTADGHELFGERGRGWNRGGTDARG